MKRNRLLQVGCATLLFCALLLGSAEAQERAAFVIRGTVVAANTQAPLPGVQVVLRGTTLSARTNERGEYSLVAPVDPGTYQLEYQTFGRRTATRPVALGAERTLALPVVALEESAVALEELVVTGTGTPTERKALGNTVESIRGEEINQAPAASTIDQALQGKIVGAVVTEHSGQPGGGVSIRLRGTSSVFGGAEPLIVVDGVIVDNNDDALINLGANAGRGSAGLSNRLADLAPSDIESIEVIKGASAAALYGSRANAGVIQIITKSGQQGEPRINFRSDLSVSSTPARYDLIDLPQAGRADVLFTLPKGAKIGDPVERFDIQDEIFQTGLGASTQLSVSGANAGTSYYLSGLYNTEEGIIRGTDYEKASVRAKVSQHLLDIVDLTLSANFIQTTTGFVLEGEQPEGVLTSVIFTPTTFRPFFDPELGRFPFNPILGANPLDVLQNWQSPDEVVRFLGNFEASVRPTEDLTLRYLFGIDDYRQEVHFVRPPRSTSLRDAGLISNPVRLSRQFNHDLTATYELGLGAAMRLNNLIGFRATSDEAEVLRIAAADLPPGQTLVGGATQFAAQSQTEVNTLSAFLQERLTWNERLFLTAGLNAEASSAFGANERWQFFPRLSASWVVDQEPWWATNPLGGFISTLRLRAAYGETGAQPPGAYIRFNNFFDVSYAGLPGLVPDTRAGNPDLEPERQREIEGGFDLGIFDDRAVLELTVYDQRTTELLLPVPLPPSRGVQSQFQNVGEVTNRGVEIALNTINLSRSNLIWRSRLGFASNRNEVEKLVTARDTLIFGYLNAVIEGQPIGVFYGAIYARDDKGNLIFDATGKPIRAKANGIPIKQVLGNPHPDFTASLNNTVLLGSSLEFDFLLDGRFGNDVANFSRRIAEFFGAAEVVEREITGDTVPGTFVLNVDRLLTFEEFIEDGSFVKLREIGLTYHLGPAWTRRLGTESASIRLAGRNLWTWTNYGGLDPEINLFASNTVAQGVDFATTPIPRTFVFGINLAF